MLPEGSPMSNHHNSITSSNGGCNNCNIWSHLKGKDYNDNQISIIGTSQGFIENGRTTGSFITYIVDSFVPLLSSFTLLIYFRDYFEHVGDIAISKP